MVMSGIKLLFAIAYAMSTIARCLPLPYTWYAIGVSTYREYITVLCASSAGITTVCTL